MIQKLQAVYRDGVFVVQQKFAAGNESPVEIYVHAPEVTQPEITDDEEWQRRMTALLDRMQQNSMPGAAQRFSREELYERR